MRNFKLFFGLLAMSVLSFGIWSCSKDTKQEKHSDNTNLEIRTQGKSCLEKEVEANPGSCTNGVYVGLITLPMYPGCVFYVKCAHTFCSTYATSNNFIGDYTIFDHNCPQFELDALSANSTWWSNFNIQVWQQVTNALLSNIIPTATSSTTFTYVTASCNQVCFVESKIDESERTAILPVRVPCSDECCKVTRIYTKNENGKFVFSHINYTSLGGTCDSNSLPCPANTVYRLPCTDGCQALLDF